MIALALAVVAVGCARQRPPAIALPTPACATRDRGVAVVGQVVRPGIYSVGARTTLASSLAAAGGLVRYSVRTAVRVDRRRCDGQRRTYVFDVDRIANGLAPDVLLADGDVVFVRDNAD